MTKLGVITDGISREFEQALTVMNEFGLTQAELQYLWDVEVGDLSDAQMDRVQRLVAAHGVEVSCVSRHIFGGLALGELSTEALAYREHLAALHRCIDMAQALDCPLARIMSFKKEMILFGSFGAEQWNVAQGAWARVRELIGGAAQIAEDRAITLVMETGNNAITNSAFLARRMVDEVGSARLKVMWDPANALYSTEAPYPDGYEALRGGCLGHIHLKDVVVEIAKATIACRQLGTGQMAPYLEDMATALKADGYAGAISLESVYRPHGGSFEDGFRASVGALKALFS
ncbi:MAG: sugar phosphate isomerase/epimerase [Chloroflexota bacterium]|nr:sugar phosphate isomerase/epimerase [Chloroflexota bacterium]